MLVAISIPIFTSRLEAAREATDLANIRNAYAEVTTAYLTDSSAHHVDVALKQTEDGWASTGDVAGVKLSSSATITGEGKSSDTSALGASKGKSVKVSVDGAGKVTIGGIEAVGQTVVSN